MLLTDNKEFDVANIRDERDINIGELIGFLKERVDLPLVFFYEGNSVRPGYHVTEVKAGNFAALDCGANPESWTEIFVQLWDVSEDRTHMLGGKFTAIIRKVTEFLSLDASAKLTFEVSDGVRPMQLYRAALPRVVNDQVHVELSARPASCKPRDRWLERDKFGSTCSADSTSAKPCCP